MCIRDRDDTFRKIYRSYVDACRQSRLLDFDDMLLYCYDLLTGRKDILAGWQNKFRYVLVDEFQDICLLYTSRCV